MEHASPVLDKENLKHSYPKTALFSDGLTTGFIDKPKRSAIFLNTSSTAQFPEYVRADAFLPSVCPNCASISQIDRSSFKHLQSDDPEKPLSRQPNRFTANALLCYPYSVPAIFHQSRFLRCLYSFKSDTHCLSRSSKAAAPPSKSSCSCALMLPNASICLGLSLSRGFSHIHKQ